MYRTFISKVSVLLVLVLSLASGIRADDGMWLLALLKRYNAEELRAMGLKIPVEQLTGENEGALSEAVLAFGSGCTGSVISGSGLILTNYHCSYGAIQQYIGQGNDIFKTGYWAVAPGQELPISGLSVTINKKIQDISGEVNAQLKKGAATTNDLREATAAVVQKYKQKYPQYNVVIKPYKNNSVFVLFLQLKYNDVRLVGVPPKDVAKFGGETDNWMWPRQSADFAFFRVYADKNGAPAAFSKTNVPLAVKTYLHISKEGYKKGDFTMSMGYPMQSDRDATSMQIREKLQALNTPTIAVRKIRQSILEDEMNKSPLVKQMYAEKYANSANYYKNAVGMNFWVDKLNVISKKQVYENEWMNWIGKDEAKKSRYATTLMDLNKELEANERFKRAQTYYSESFNIACDVIQFIGGFDKAFKTYGTDVKTRPSLYRDFSNNVNLYYKSINVDVDRRITKEMLKLLKDSLSADLLPAIFSVKQLHSNARIDQYVDEVFRTSVFCDSAKLKNWLKDPAFPIENDPMLQMVESISEKQMEIFRTTQSNVNKANKIVYSYYNSLSDYKDGRYYPDADKTIRLSYGTVSDLQLEGKTIPYQTTLSSLVAKANPLHKDFQLNNKLQAIWQNKDYGSYAVDGDLPVCFITNGDVTGGNSGSPMMNGEGKIIGLVFDCNWESMTREFNYETNLHKVICVDIRYLLLVTEKFSGTDRIIGEIEKANQYKVTEKEDKNAIGKR